VDVAGDTEGAGRDGYGGAAGVVGGGGVLPVFET